MPTCQRAPTRPVTTASKRRPDASCSFVIGCPSTGDGVVILTDDPDGRAYYRSVVERELPGDHASLRVEHNPTWLEHFV